MDEPDADELAWMASEPFPEENYEEFYEDGADAQPKPSHPAPGDIRRQSPAEDLVRKRVLNQPSVIDQAGQTAKRVRSVHNVSSPPAEEVPAYPPSPDSPTGTNGNGNAGNHGDIPSPPPEVSKPADNCAFRMASSIAGEFVTVTGPSGERVYAKVDRSGNLALKPHGGRFKSTKGLLAQPIEEMLEQAEAERAQKMFGDNHSGHLPEVLPGQPAAAHEQLWVEKYAPKSFTDLLSDEQTNRQVLRWLKQWDASVFGLKSDSSTSKQVFDTLRRKAIPAEGQGLNRTFQQNGQNRTFKQDPFGNNRTAPRDGPFKSRSDSWSSKRGGSVFEAFGSQPAKEIHEKVLLLCGPPGLGKTTLAHIAARHCGYRIVEINASDDRVAATLQAKILDAVQMKSVVGDSRPNCLIIDEIDGAVGGTEGRSAIKQLVDIITATSKKNRGGEESQAKDDASKGIPKKKNTAATHRLSRPIICICNDLYAPALRPLRQIARVHMFSRPSASRVVTRLKYICTEEGFKTNIRALTTLSEQAESDIRACLNTLQFLKRKGQPLTIGDVGSQIIGSKDMTRSVYDVWGEVFRKMDKSFKGNLQQPKPGVSKLAQDQLQFLRVYDLISNFGDHELSIDGVHENFLNTGYQDSSLAKTVECLHVMGDSDIRNKEVYAKQRYFVNGYQPSTLITIRGLIAVPARPTIQWPRNFQKHKAEAARKREMLNTWFNQMSPQISRSVSISPLTLDVLSPLLAILSPPLRPVAVQLYTSAEKQTMKQLLETMVVFGLTYKHSRVADLNAGGDESNWPAQGEIHLDPPVNSLVTFEGSKSQYRPLSTTICQMLGHQIELERIQRESLPSIKSDGTVIRERFTRHTKGTITEKLKPQAPLSKLPTAVDTQSESKTQDQQQDEAAQNGDLPSNAPVGEKDAVAQKDVAQKKDAVAQKDVAEKKDVMAQKDVAEKKDVVGGRKDNTSALPATKVKKLNAVTYQVTNFFDGWRKKGSQGGNEKKASESPVNQRDMRPLLYKFHEGFTNAIRRPMRVKEFL